MAQWQTVAVAEDLQQHGDYRVVELDGDQIIIINIVGELYAVENLCSHDSQSLAGDLGGAALDLNEGAIICPRHGARFSIKTGEALTAPAFEPINAFPVRCQNGEVQLQDTRWD